MATFDPERIDQLVGQLRDTEAVFENASADNDTAQAGAQVAIAMAAGTAQTKIAAHDNLSLAIDNLVEYVLSLK